MDSEEKQIHVMFLPYLAPGHMMPMVDMARLLAGNGLKVTIITTTMNAAQFQNAIDRDIKSGRQISLATLRFPSIEAGLPEGCENLSSTTTPEMTLKLFHGIELLQPHIKMILQKHRPDCIASDYLFPWTVDVAIELGIPRLAFNGSGFFNLCVANSIDCHRPHNNVTSETEQFVIPGLPDKVTITRSQLPDIVKGENEVFSALFDKLKEAERKSFGVLMNSFYELEPAYADHFRKVTGIKAWHLGPVSLFNRNAADRLERGGETSIRKHSCLDWLESKKPKSVLYICFGSLTRFSKTQISEIASALEESKQFYNEKLITQVLKLGVPVGNETWKVWANEESPLINRDKIEKAVRTVMGDTDEAMEMRKQASRLEAFAKMTIEEGGSSCNDLKALIEDIRTYKHATGRGESR
ncbi:scopoletin glucosyltransferase-like [Populus alba x Populus x berolinensis]|uniref:Scopoletin glucosyltransferase-like n=1 Tax=Populus alba x Populus x berolinensis TaxID=444605 RepID=A0AAD6WE59_9ROSI|nr:scopoletin glucosyltransferase-like [Populus alba x Populus x berolinensis]